MDCKIEKYEEQPAKLIQYDPIYPEVAEYLMNFIKIELTKITIHHIGSTSIPGCDGKGIIDISYHL